ncbi:hypothetical protein EIP91_003071 [Steccherinum ochraceum]|uniref:Uncharacterized protein n=1 Tax=Steccherinum ochraceum TaxID=92696 RepID=A0A4V2MW92_9APHY|nr:hypothetical protein EIP91_003071 [Steccherinum ochraceum]
MSDPSSILPDSLNLPPHLSAQKYFFVCTLTVAAWDTLVLSPRAWRLFRTKEWPILKIFFHILRFYMPIEFTIVGVAFFDTKWSQDQTCSHFYLFEPIMTAILLAMCSAVHVIRIHAIYEKSRAVLTGMGGLLALQIVVTGIACGFFRSTPLKEGQGCIASPKHNWVGIYWLSATLLYTASLVLAVNRSLKSLSLKPISYWKLMLRDGLNLYGAIWGVNMVNMLFWFIMTPTGIEDPIKTIVTSMAAVLTTSMTLRIILSVRGSLVSGGSFAVTSASHPSRSGGTTHVISASRRGDAATNPVLSLQQPQPATYTVPLEAKEREWVGTEYDGKSSVGDKEVFDPATPRSPHDNGVKITVATETDYDAPFQAK